MGQDILQRDHKNTRGTILYTSTKAERQGQERGREYFVISVHADGARSISAHLYGTSIAASRVCTSSCQPG